MKISALCFLLVLAGTSLHASEKLTIERIMDSPNLDGKSPKSLKASPDGRRVTYLKEKTNDLETLDLWEFNLDTKKHKMLMDSAEFLKGSENLSAEEKARRERLRISQKGIVEYFWSASGNALIFPLAGGIYFYSLESSNAKIKLLTHVKDHETDAHISRNGKYVSYVRKGNLYYIDTQTLKEQQITKDASATIKNGIAEFIAQEEMDRMDGQWWSKDERYLAFTRVDESKVPVEKRYEINADTLEVFEQRYPKTGAANAKVSLHIYDTQNPGKLHRVALSENPDVYLARVKWLPDSKKVAVQVESRDQKTLTLFLYDTRIRTKKILLTEKDSKWINLTDDFTFLKNNSGFIWSSESSGYRHLYQYDLNGKLVKQLTAGNWQIRELITLNEKEDAAYFTASIDSPLEQHLYQLNLASGEIVKITKEEGWHQLSIPDSAKVYIDSYSNAMQPTQVSLRSIDGNLITYIEENRVDSKHPLNPFYSNFSAPEFGSFKNKEGTEFYYSLLKPKNFTEGKKYPVVVDVYGGPNYQKVKKNWAGKRFYWQQILADKGYLVFQMDNRGSLNRGHAFETAIYHQLGNVEVVDQKAGVDWLLSQGFTDPNRVGVFGWSYGGYMALLTLLKEPGTFKAAVSVAPVTDWTLYDTHYTERFMGTPKENLSGYKKSNVLEYAANLKAPLLMIHGMADDNVLFTNSTKIYQLFQSKALAFEMMTYPGSKHGIYGKFQQTHVYNTITNFFDKNLMPAN